MKTLRFVPMFLLTPLLGAALLLASPAQSAEIRAAAADVRGAPFSFADLAEKLQPAVVNISTSQTINASADGDGLPPDLQLPPGSPFEQFFKDFMDKQKNAPHKRKSTA